MYFEEKIIDGILCWRISPDKDFTYYSIEELSKRVVELQRISSFYSGKIKTAIDALSD